MQQPTFHEPSAEPAPPPPSLPPTMEAPTAVRPRWPRLPPLHGAASALASVTIHALLLVLFALWAYGTRGGPAPGEEVQIAQLPIVELSDDTPDLETRLESQPAEDLELMELTPLSAADSGQLELSDIRSPLGFGGQGQIDSGDLADTGMAAQASFMGLQARGQRFCIIADCSGSMKGRKIEFLKSEVLRTIGGLSGGTRFQIFFFNGRAVPYPHSGWRRPQAEIGSLRRWLDSIAARGGTEPREAFERTFELRPLPDSIFFMTDGQFDGDTVDLVLALNKGSNKGSRRVPIHAITFIDRSAERAMRSIAASSGGKYRHVAGF